MALDLLEENPQPFVLVDRGFASRATRFLTGFAWVFQMPHFARLDTDFVPFASIDSRSIAETLSVIADHLQAPTRLDERRAWLPHHLLRVLDSLAAANSAYTKRATLATDFTSHALDFESKLSTAELRSRLAEAPNWLECEESGRLLTSFDLLDHTALDVPDIARVVATVHLSNGLVRLTCQSRANLQAAEASLRECFNAELQEKSRVEEDLGINRLKSLPTFDEALVPPALVIATTGLGVATYRRFKPTEGSLIENVENARVKSMLTTPAAFLNHKLPKEAANDPSLRPLVVVWAKSIMNRADKEALNAGTVPDINWVARELNLPELDVPPPPLRDIPEDETEDDLDDDNPGFDDLDKEIEDDDDAALFEPRNGVNTWILQEFSVDEVCEILDDLDPGNKTNETIFNWFGVRDPMQISSLAGPIDDPEELEDFHDALTQPLLFYFTPFEFSLVVPQATLAAEMSRVEKRLRKNIELKGVDTNRFFYGICEQPELAEVATYSFEEPATEAERVRTHRKLMVLLAWINCLQKIAEKRLGISEN